MFDNIKRLFKRQDQAPKTKGIAVPTYNKYSAYIDRRITLDVIADTLKVPKVLSCIASIPRLAFPGFDFSLLPLVEGDDTQGEKIKKAMAEIQRLDRILGRAGKQDKIGTLGLVKRTFWDVSAYRQALFEYNFNNIEGAFRNPGIVQWLPARSFSQAPYSISGNDNYVQDYLLKGIIYNSAEQQTEFWQTPNQSKPPVQIPSENIIYIEDQSVADDTSLVASIVPSVEQWKMLRKNLMLAMHRVGAPNEVAQIDAAQFADAKERGLSLNFQDILDYAKDLIQAQSTETAKVSMPGMRLEYPTIDIPIDPTLPDQYLKKEILEHFFPRDILEVTAQAISATSAPINDLLDQMFAGYRETCGKPWESFWTQWLELNGFELVCQFDWWDITPEDKDAEHKRLVEDFRSRYITINEARQAAGYPALDEAELAALIAEQKELWTRPPSLFGGGGAV